MGNYAIILAAGKGTRMKSSLYKVMHKVCGKAMVEHVISHVENVGMDKIVTIVGFGAEAVKDLLKERSEYALQSEQLGTGHAVKQAKAILGHEKGTTLVICGDTPLIAQNTIRAVMQHHQESGAKATILTAYAKDPSGYGRVVRNQAGFVEKSVEHKDATPSELLIQEINTGTYVFDNQALFDALEHVTNDNAQGEYYLPDVLEILKQAGHTVSAYKMAHIEESLGINDRVALAQAEALMRQRINLYHMQQGVTLIDPRSTYIESDVTIGSDTIIEPNVFIKGKTTIGKGCMIGMNSELVDMTIADNVTIRSSCLEQSIIASGVDIGPMAHIRPHSVLESHVHVGNFVEVKNATIGSKTKMGHLTYIGDATLGERINVGCGTIVVNYDGKHKHRSIIGSDSFIGCNANLVSPVTIGHGAFVAAGSTITKDVPDSALAIARSRQENKLNYAENLPHKK